MSKKDKKRKASSIQSTDNKESHQDSKQDESNVAEASTLNTEPEIVPDPSNEDKSPAIIPNSFATTPLPPPLLHLLKRPTNSHK
mmetsp:Transcript_10825/g.13241  ORF Transcript_10825/g.13241 Transcript_10825/m.13241 type:complete len:84 (+) Transcript_10825:85-336(+)